MDDSLFEIDGPPSSPFVSQLTETNSRASSKQYDAQVVTQNAAPEAQGNGVDDTQIDKENVSPEPQSVSKPLGPRPSPGLRERQQCQDDAEMMPPPARRLKQSPAKSVSSPRSGLLSSPLRKEVRPMSRDHETNVDDTCFSTFSEVQDLTWTKARSPFKLDDISNGQSPRARRTPMTSRKRLSTSRSPSPTPRRARLPESSPTCLIDFTEQIENIMRPGLPSSRTEPDLLQHLQKQRSPVRKPRQSLATPAKQNSILNLLDFELPPAPTPRSVPTITVRELETLKSQYLSQISSLKATLNGREAEVESFKRAIGDAERRVGEAQEALREEKIRREQAEQEKLDWERRGLEVENVLKNVKEEVLKAEAEKEELFLRAEQCEKQADAAEVRAAKAEEQLAAMEAVALGSGDVNDQVQKLVAIQIDSKIEGVSRELHAVYKEKHERKVATLKQSYEARSQKRMAELQSKVTKLERANDELLVAKAALVPLPPADDGEAVQLKTQLEEQKALLARVQQELKTSKAQRQELVHALEQERIEKGDLVAAVDEMLALQAEQGPTQGAMSVVEDFRKSISRPPTAHGIRSPVESKIGRIPPARTPAGKSKMLANIERMGRTTSNE